MRTGGATALASLGVNPYRIQAMGRWKSDLVIRYSCGRTTVGITDETIRALQALDPAGQGRMTEQPGSSSDRPPAPVVRATEQVRADGVNMAVRAIDHEIADVADAGPRDRSSSAGRMLILNGTSGVLHASCNASRTLCGNVYTGWRYMAFEDMVEGLSSQFICRRCFPLSGRQRRLRIQT